MAEFKTPTSQRVRSKTANNCMHRTSIEIPASPFLQTIGYGSGVKVFTLERSPKVGFARSPWAVKKRNRNVPKDEKYNERLRFEAEVLRKLEHPNIVGFRGFTEAGNGEPVLVMEKLDCSLGDLIAERLDEGGDAFPARSIKIVANELAKGLAYLHHIVHLLHGDMKSYNVLVSKNFKHVKICDFGVSIPLTKSLEMDKSKGQFHYVGTECWSAPEIIFEDGPVTNKADIWAYGLTIWEMLALSPPHITNTEDSSIETTFDDSISELTSTNNKKELKTDESMNESVTILEEITKNTCGTRPPLPSTLNFTDEYGPVLELFYICTNTRLDLRPSAEAIVKYFERYGLCNPNQGTGP